MRGDRGRSAVEQPSSLHAEHAYEITVKGEISGSWLAGWGNGEVPTEQLADGEQRCTRFTIVTDQAGLVGLIRRLHGLGVAFVSVRQAPATDALVQPQTR